MHNQQIDGPEADTGPVTDQGRGTDVGSDPDASAPSGGLHLSRSVGIVLTLIGFVVGGAALADNSLLTHMATGELILDRRSVPSADPYSGTAPGLPWTVQSWLVSVLYAFSDRLVGLPAVRLLHGVVGAAVAGGLWQLTAPARQVVPRFVLTAVPLLLGVGFWSPRPLMFGLAAMVVLLQVLQLGRPPILVVPLMWLWANSHGSYPLAFVLLGTVLAGTWLDSRAATAGGGADEALDTRDQVMRLAGGEIPVRDLRLLGLTVVGTLAAVIGPLGLRVLTFPFQLLRNRDALEGVVEWQAPTFKSSWELLVLSLLPLVVVATKRGAGWRALMPSLVFLASALVATRNIAVASLVIVAMIAPAYRDLFGLIDGDATSLLSRTLGKAAVAGLVVASVAILVSPALELKWYPEAEVDFLEERGLAPMAENGPVLVHREAVGNYLTYRYGDRASVFIDDRFDFYPQDVIDDHLVLLNGGDFDEVLDRRAAQIIIWQADELLSGWLADSPKWRTAHSSDDWIVACRVGGTAADRCR